MRESLRRMIEVVGISARSITVSTVGMVPGLRRLAEEPWPVNVTVRDTRGGDIDAACGQLRGGAFGDGARRGRDYEELVDCAPSKSGLDFREDAGSLGPAERVRG